jgi:hypothetical protein
MTLPCDETGAALTVNLPRLSRGECYAPSFARGLQRMRRGSVGRARRGS